MNKLIADIAISIATVDNDGNLVRTETMEWNTEESEDIVLTQVQIRDAIDSLCEFLDISHVELPKIQETKEKKSGE